ncbi:MAG: type IV pili methyl-accepting chemotaxis transducer N-terminal domain-containing protein [Bacteroidota bacterium]
MKTLTSKYIAILVILTLAIMGSQLFMQKTINDSKTDARIINISGRQRMLSQKITKASLKLTNAPDEPTFLKVRNELAEATRLWSYSHHQLQYGSSELDVNEFNESNKLKGLFNEIAPFFNLIETSANYLSSISFSDLIAQSRKDVIREKLLLITKNEARFLDLMNKITFQYDYLASSKIDFLSSIEYYLLAFTLMLIIIEVFLVIRPLFIDSKKKDLKIDTLTLLLDNKKSFASDQIDQANKMIANLRSLAGGLKKELDEGQRNYTLKATEHMKKYTGLMEEHQKLKQINKALILKNETLANGTLYSN